MLLRINRRLFLPLIGLFASTAAMAEDVAPGWQPGFAIAPYGWLAGIDGDIGTASGDGGDGGLPDFVSVALDDDLDLIGFMFYAEWRGDRWLAFFDSVWANVARDGEIRLAGTLPLAEARAGIDGNVYQLSLAYRLAELGPGTIALYGGARYYDLEADVQFEDGILPQPVMLQGAETWTDAVAGARWDYRLNEKWGGVVLADVGFGESDTSWQLFATVAYRFNERGSVVFGYRYLALDYDTPEYLVDLALSGPAIGVGFRF